MSYELGLSSVASNKYEAILYFDVNGASAGTPSLTDGNYQIVAFNSLWNAAGNALGRTGYAVNGASQTISFSISLPAGQESIVNDTTAGIQDTTASQRAVASDGKGDYVVAWIYEGQGVYAKLYNASGTALTSEFCVSADIYAAQAAVAMDGDGDFVVTWASNKNNPSNTSTSWDVFARCYNALGTAKTDVFMVNTYTDNIQCNPSVALDAQGDFFIAWQSFGEDGSGYGIYAQRDSAAGDRLGGTNESQLFTLVGNPTGTFALSWTNYGSSTASVSADIAVTGVANDALAAKIEAALKLMGADVNVTVLSTATLLVTFVNKNAYMDVPLITLDHYDLHGATGSATATLNITAQVNGVSSEFQVNDTTANDQKDPAVAASSQGGYIVTWTSYGQDDDSLWDSNIYGKQFVSNSLYEATSTSLTLVAASTKYQVNPLVTTTDDPANHVVAAGTGADGVVSVEVDLAGGAAQMGSGALLADRFHVLTAAHVVCMANSNQLASNNVFVTFTLATGNVTIAARSVTVNPNFTGDIMTSPDIAIITLSQLAPAGVKGYTIYSGNDQLGKIFQFYGYGTSGTGQTGNTLAYGTKREGENEWETTANILDSTYNSTILIFDFDSGSAANDALNAVLGISDVGLGEAEANQAPGDSGGPCLLNGMITAIVTAGLSVSSTDVNGTTDASFGELTADTNVSAYADWINAIITGGGGPEFLVNQTVQGSQKWSDVAVDADGDFAVTWTSYGQDGGGNGYGAGYNGENGVYARRFNSDTSAATDEFLVNTTIAENQQHSQIAMDAAGDFVIVWESYQDRPAINTGLNDSPNSYGIYAQRYARTALVGVDTSLGINGRIGTEFRLNTTTDGDQWCPAVAMDANGDFVTVWSGYGAADPASPADVFFQRYQKTTDATGPFVTEIDNYSSATSTLVQVFNNVTLSGNVTKIVITFDESLSTNGGAGGTHSVTNLSNWTLSQSGMSLTSGVSSVKYGLNQAYTLGLTSSKSGKYEAVITLDGDSSTSGNQTLVTGSYSLVILDAVQDAATPGNAFDGNMDGTPGGSWTFNFTVNADTSAEASVPPTVTPPGNPTVGQTDQQVNTTTTGVQSQPSVATNSLGEYVVVWTTATTANGYDIVGQRYDKYGAAVGAQFSIGSYTAGDQVQPDVAMDPMGNFVVVWAGAGAEDSVGVYARVYTYAGTPVNTQFIVNQYTTNNQVDPHVAMDDNGDFVVSWTSYGQDGNGGGIYARRFNKLGKSLGNEFLVNSATTYYQETSDVAMDSVGNFVVVWASDQQDGSSWGVYGQRYNSSGTRLGGEFKVNTYTNNKQLDPQVAMDSAGDFFIAWSSFGQDGSGYGIYARRYNSAERRPRNPGVPRQPNHGELAISTFRERR